MASQSSARVLVSGAAGFVGSHVADSEGRDKLPEGWE